MVSDLLRFLTIIGAGIPAGSQLLVATNVAPRLAGLPPELGYQMHDALLHHAHHNAIAAGPSVVAALSGIALLIIDGVTNLAGIFTLVGVLGIVGVSGATMRVNAPENNRIRRLLEADERPPYAQTIARWRRAHIVRSSSGLSAFVAFTVAALAS